MRKFKLNNENSKVEPTAEQVNKYKNFSQVSRNSAKLAKRPKKPLYKDPKMFLFILLIGIIAFLIFNESEKEQEREPEKIESVDEARPKR